MLTAEVALMVAIRFLHAVGITPEARPQIRPVPREAFLIDLPTWQLFVTQRVGAAPRVRSLLRKSRKPLVRVSVPPPDRASKLAKALFLPADARLTRALTTELQWERGTPGNYPHYQHRVPLLYLKFHPEDGQLLLMQDELDLLDGVTLPPLRIGAEAAVAVARALLSFGPPSAEKPREAPVLAWTPWRGELTPADAERIWKSPGHRGAFPLGRLRLAWLMGWDWCHVGVDPTSGTAVYFEKSSSQQVPP